MAPYSPLAVASLLLSASASFSGIAIAAAAKSSDQFSAVRGSHQNTAAAAAPAAARSLASEKLLGYKFENNMDDHARIDMDQQAIELALAIRTSTSFDNAQTIYENGGHSKSYARLQLQTSLPTKVKKGSDIKGKTADGTTIHAKAYEQAEEGDTIIEVQYPTDESALPCFVGALNLVDKEETAGCFAPTGKLTIGGIKVNYDYDVEEENLNGRTIAGFSLGAKKKMYDTNHGCAGCPYPEYSAFVDYYGNYEYADDWVKAALSGKPTPFQGAGNADFSKFGFVGKAEAAKKGTAYMAIWMYVIRELRDAIDDCNVECDLECAADDPTCTQCNDEPVKAWDEGVAFYSGSLAEQEDTGDGYLLLSLANKRGLNFGTHTDGMSWVNTEIFENFHEGAKHLAERDCKKAEKKAERIIALMQVPLIQGTLRYAHKLSVYGSVEQDDAATIEKHNGEGATFAAAILPMLNKCNPKDAETVYKHMKVGKLRADYPAVKKAFQNNYECLGITCEDVGGVLNDESKYFLDKAGPCGSGQAFKRYGSSPSSAGDKKFSVGASIGIAIGAFIGFALVALGLKKATGGGSGKEEIKEEHTAPVESYSAQDTGEKSII